MNNSQLFALCGCMSFCTTLLAVGEKAWVAGGMTALFVLLTCIALWTEER